ncbi:hypothetical protein NKI78_04470 [Mesorhizobium sp. M0400]|uniref:hypothetical protein n=1 Tax=Mesorhizobium sp. M0400 TaxID=2956941 RepID=UPI00333926D6
MMAREYLIRPRAAHIDDEPDGEHYLARTVFEDFELIDTGVLDAFGNKVMARRRLDPIGFIRHK